MPPTPPNEPDARAPEDGDAALDAGLRAAFDREATPGESILDRLEARVGRRPSVMLPSTGSGPVLVPAGRQPPSAGRRIGRYQILGEVARGGVGVVLKGRDLDLGRDVAMKLLKDQHLGRGELIQRFVEEAQIAGQLQHPAIVPVYELGIDDEQRPFFTMKLIEGQTLSRLLNDRPDPSADRMRNLRVFETVCDALGYAHARGVVHRDLKPANILVGAFGEVQVVDWGFAKVLPRGGVDDEVSALRDARDAEFVATVRSGPDGIESHYGAIIGTPSYMPPEQARGEVDVIDERSDVFSLGAILCEILTGSPPFAGGSVAELIQQATKGDLSGAFERLAACDADQPLVQLARSCLAPDRLQRPRDAGYVAVAVSDYLASIETRARAAEVRAAEASASAAAERRSRQLTLVLAATVLAAVCLGALGWSWSAERERTRIERVEARIESVLREASGHAGSSDWTRALVTLEQGEVLAAGDEVSDALRASLTQELAAARSALEDQTLAARLDRIRSAVDSDYDDSDYDDVGNEEYAEAFAAYGLDMSDASPADVAERIGRGSPLALDVAFALDDWVWRTWPLRPTATADADRLVAIARHLDQDPWRNELRSAALALDLGRLRELEQAADFETLPPPSLQVLGMGLLVSGDRDLAVSVLDRGVALHPGDFHLNLGLAMILWRGGETEAAGDRERAELHARIAIALRPDHGGPRALLAGIDVRNGDAEAAAEHIDEAEARGADPFRVNMLRLEVLRANRDHAGALALADEMLAERPGHPVALWMRIDALIELGRPDEVRTALEELVAAGSGRRGERGNGRRGGPGRRTGGFRPGGRRGQHAPDVDADGSGAVERPEVPERLRPYFDLLDRDGDGVLTGEEAWVLRMEHRSRRR